jgi:transcriptional regulator with GAF, ATPase, and Fis domain
MSPNSAHPQNFASGLAFEDAERMFETEMIVKALRRANFVQTRAAEMLGISRRILKYKMDKLRINERGEVVREQDS